MSVTAARIWPKKRLKYAVSLRRTRVDGMDEERPYIGLEQIESGTGRLVPTASAAESARDTLSAAGESLSNIFEPGDVLFGKLRPYLAKAWIAEFAGRCTTELVVMQPTDFDARFLRYVCLSRDFVDAVDASTFGSKMPRADWDFIGNMPVPLPTLRCQRVVADYLDRETARLDGLVAAKERVLGLLAEKRRALITRAVTRGLDPCTPFRNSGIPWLGEIPSYWGIIKLKHIAMISYGVSDELDKSLISGTPLISLPNVDIDGTLSLADLGWADLDEGERPGLLLKQGDLLFNWRNGSSEHLAKTAYFHAEGEFTHVGFLLRIRFDLRRFESRFYKALLNALRATGFFLYSRAMVNNTFNQTELENLSVVVPPLSEQREIVAHISAETAKLDALRAATERTIALLKERRAALIAAAVTGKLDVHGAERHLDVVAD